MAPPCHDRLSGLPDCLLHAILSGLGSRQAVKTSLLSRRWRQLWRDVPCANIDEREFADDTWERFQDFADHVLTSIPSETQLDAFRLHLLRKDSYSSSFTSLSDRWIRRGLWHSPMTVDIRAASDNHIVWLPYMPPISPNSLETVSSAASYNRRLTKLHLVQVRIEVSLTLLGESCPVLEELHMERYNVIISEIASPTLKRLAVISPSSYGCKAEPLRLMAPRLASLRLEITYDCWRHYYPVVLWLPDQKPLALLTEASIRLTGLYKHQPDQPEWQGRKLEFLKSVISFLVFLPNVAYLHLSGFTVEATQEETFPEFPVLHNLKTLILEECGVGTNFQVLTSILPNTPNMEKLGLHKCIFLVAPGKKRRKSGEQASKGRPPVFWCKKLKSIEVKRRPEDEPRMLKVLSEIHHGMLSSWWRRVKIYRVPLCRE